MNYSDSRNSRITDSQLRTGFSSTNPQLNLTGQDNSNMMNTLKNKEKQDEGKSRIRGINTKIHRAFVIMRLLLTLMIIFLTLLLMKKSLEELKEKSEKQKLQLKYLLRNWQSSHLKVIFQSKKKCSELETGDIDIEYKYWNYTWGGSRDACDCRKSDRYSLESKKLEKKIYWQECSPDMNFCKCKGSKGQDPVLLDNFYDFENRAKNDQKWICLKMDKSITYKRQIRLRTGLKTCIKG